MAIPGLNGMKKEITLFILIPIVINALSLGLYYSGVYSLQQIIAPQIPGLLQMSYREFGLVEQMQNIFLLAIIILFLIAIIRRKGVLERLIFLSGLLVMLFLLLEEIDYGLHFYHYYFDGRFETPRLNWHNQHTFSDYENGRYLRKISDFLSIILFIIMPLLSLKINFKRLKPLIPSLWFIPALIVSALCSSVGHFLEDNGFGIINGSSGFLEGNVSEFRETTSYYIYLLYAIQLTKTVCFTDKTTTSQIQSNPLN
jgi:hypothetical protein